MQRKDRLDAPATPVKMSRFPPWFDWPRDSLANGYRFEQGDQPQGPAACRGVGHVGPMTPRQRGWY